MYNDPKEVAKAKERLNAVSKSFCMAKWMHTTLHLQMGRTHSCYLNPTHQIPLDSLEERPESLHNTPQKVAERKQMLTGERPAGCQACWDVEDLPGEHFSERHYRGQDCWTKPFYDQVANSSAETPITPSYLEVSFSAACNFKCSYCAPTYSSSWQKEVNEHGGYQLTHELAHHDPHYLKQNGEMPLSPDQENPYTQAFWKWWPELTETLMFFRITGGEPLLHKDTFKVFNEIQKNPMPELELSLNSNLGINQEIFDRFISHVSDLKLDSPTERHVKKFMLHTSIDTYGEQAEYIRNGLHFESFKNNVESYLLKVPAGNLSFMVTFNALSLSHFNDLLNWLLELRQKYQTSDKQILFDTPHLKHPRFMSLQMLPETFQAKMGAIIEFMQANLNNDKGIKESELLKMKRMLSWMEAPNPQKEREQRDFRLFFKEHDKRRSTSFEKVFPEYHSLFNGDQ